MKRKFGLLKSNECMKDKEMIEAYLKHNSLLKVILEDCLESPATAKCSRFYCVAEEGDSADLLLYAKGGRVQRYCSHSHTAVQNRHFTLTQQANWWLSDT